ncbi:MAG: nucleoside deaminase [Metallibacterium scheffleri]|jgi:tRNA(Arg) A34 adenosine deaminase TadA|uniref:nucleoside deaminase n=1 Tax=Metallibacterium scheffleri TaxID=993689 RepID=UPI0026ED1B12|nr:nucleoside deaminase [Metallibacterium scheffleri]MCK9366359.1 nucleoside deaminase [Metallibacterium scheffleri]
MLCAQVHLTLPAWLQQADLEQHGYADADARMALAIELARRNIEHGSGGPFGAALFTRDGRLLGVGVNRVEAMNCSVAHAEMMAFMTAQTRLARYRLNAHGLGIVLATSAQPCCQCYGASFWAGIDTMLIGARSEDVMRLTAFDEGPLPADWIGELERRGIVVQRDVQRAQACAVLADYAARGGLTY